MMPSRIRSTAASGTRHCLPIRRTGTDESPDRMAA
jgi:hypothetical protein